MVQIQEVSINLFTTFYFDSDLERHEEYLFTISKNLADNNVKNIIFLIEPNIVLPFESEKIHIVPVQKRPTYNEFITAINSFTDDESFNIIAVTDIYFDKSIVLLNQINWNKTVVGLTRWDVLDENTARFFNRYYTNDTWIFKGKAPEIDANFYLGQPGCDNRFNYDLFDLGYEILNPSLTISTWHLHKSQIRSYISNPSQHPRVDKPYLYLLPDFGDFNVTDKNYFVKKKLYKQIRYELYKAILFNKLGTDVYLQAPTKKLMAFFKCIYYFNYKRKSLQDVRFKIKDVVDGLTFR